MISDGHAIPTWGRAIAWRPLLAGQCRSVRLRVSASAIEAVGSGRRCYRGAVRLRSRSAGACESYRTRRGLETFPDTLRTFQRGKHDAVILDDVRDLAFVTENQEKLQGKYNGEIEVASTQGGSAGTTWICSLSPSW